DALESEGWSVWWDPNIWTRPHYDEVIETAALREAKCVVVMWSERSVQSFFVGDVAYYALDHKKLVSVAMEKVTLPFDFTGVHTLNLIDWDGSKNFSEYRRLIDDISMILEPSSTVAVTETGEPEVKDAKRKGIQEKENRAQREAEQRHLKVEAQRKAKQER